jgi:hypothetical protein
MPGRAAGATCNAGGDTRVCFFALGYHSALFYRIGPIIVQCAYTYRLRRCWGDMGSL